jgi:hypothetical protein
LELSVIKGQRVFLNIDLIVTKSFMKFAVAFVRFLLGGVQSQMSVNLESALEGAHYSFSYWQSLKPGNVE